MTLQTILLTIHSWVRWLVLLVAILAVIKHIIGWAGSSEYDGMARGLMSAFTGLIDLNVLIGLIQLIAFWGTFSAIAGGFPQAQVEHFGTMLVAAFVAHAPNIFYKDKPDAIRYRNGAIAIVIAVALIVVGIMPLMGARWVFRGL